MTWGSINLNAGSGNLPPPGNYPAMVADLRLHEKPDVLWCAVQFSLDGMTAAPRDVVRAIAARDDSRYVSQMAEGLRFLNRLSQAVGVEIAGVDYEELPKLLIGKRLELTVVHSMQDGVADLVVRAMRPLLASE
jgi:hypothetical protein